MTSSPGGRREQDCGQGGQMSPLPSNEPCCTVRVPLLSLSPSSGVPLCGDLPVPGLETEVQQHSLSGQPAGRPKALPGEPLLPLSLPPSLLPSCPFLLSPRHLPLNLSLPFILPTCLPPPPPPPPPSPSFRRMLPFEWWMLFLKTFVWVWRSTFPSSISVVSVASSFWESCTTTNWWSPL